jgi:hypothetical protein
VSGRGHDGFVVIHREDIQDDFGHRRVGGAQQRLGVAAAILEFKPDQRRALDRIQGLGNLWRKRGRQCGWLRRDGRAIVRIWDCRGHRL